MSRGREKDIFREREIERGTSREKDTFRKRNIERGT